MIPDQMVGALIGAAVGGGLMVIRLYWPTRTRRAIRAARRELRQEAP